MAIQDVGSMAQLLQTYDSNQWIKSANLNAANPLSLEDAIDLDNKTNLDRGKSFSDMMASAIADVNKYQHEANEAIQRLATGQNKNIHETMLAVEKADIAFRAMNQVRSKVLDAYKEIMRMQV